MPYSLPDPSSPRPANQPSGLTRLVPSTWTARLIYLLVVALVAGATGSIAALLMNIYQRKDEGKFLFIQWEGVDENTVDPEAFRATFPRQYDGYQRTALTHLTRRGGSEGTAPETDVEEPVDKLQANLRLKVLFAGYPFEVDYRERRGHAFMLFDQDKTKRVTQFTQPGACLHCHASIIPAYREAGEGDVQKGFVALCKMPLVEARKKVSHPVSCIDCHDPKTMRLRVTRPAFLNAMKELAAGPAAVPHLPSVDQWRKDRSSKKGDHYDPNVHASRNEMRSFVCGQCHVEYYFKGEGKVVTYPWDRGLNIDDIEAYYDGLNYHDWVHRETGARVLKAQHPEFELWSQGIHARSGVSCADCHMPYMREGAVKISDHHVRSPLLNIARACQTCHRYSEEEIKERTRIIQVRNKKLLEGAEKAVVDLIGAIKSAKGRGATDAELNEARALHRRAQWRVDFINAENSMGFHAPQEAARILGEGINFARQGELKGALLKR